MNTTMIITKKQKKNHNSNLCYFCLWNTGVAKIYKGREVLSACTHCFNIMHPLIESKGGIWGWSLAALRPIHPESAKLQHKQLLKCEHCNFRTIYRDSMNHHLKLTHRPNHPFPPNIQTEASKHDWLQKVGKW